MKIKCLIVDDEKPARELLESYANKVPDLEVVGVLKNPLDALNTIQKDRIDILFLDIQMPEISGVNLLDCLGEEKPLVIFTTAYQDYALQGYELDVFDYMLKPISFERFLKGVNKAIKQIHLKKGSLKQNIHMASDANTKDYIVLKADYKIYKVKFCDIHYIEGLKEYVTFYTTNKKIIVYESLKNLQATLPSNFLRIHKSFIVNKNWVKAMHGNQLEILDVKIPIGISYKDTVKMKIFDD